jgi:hypothetical protein
MLSTRSKVTRRTESSYSVLYSGSNKRRPIVVTILPGDVLEFREHGRRQRYVLAVDNAFRYAVRLSALAKAAEKYRNKIDKPRKRTRR